MVVVHMRKKVLPLLLAGALLSIGALWLVYDGLPQGYPMRVRYDYPVIPAESPRLVVEAAESQDELLVEQETEEAEIQETVRFPLELNTATYEELVTIPKVGDVTAQRILQYRQHLGGYKRLEQLLEIKGIGEKIYLEICPYVFLTNEGS